MNEKKASKTLKAFRLSDKALNIVENLVGIFGKSQTEVVESITQHSFPQVVEYSIQLKDAIDNPNGVLDNIVVKMTSGEGVLRLTPLELGLVMTIASNVYYEDRMESRHVYDPSSYFAYQTLVIELFEAIIDKYVEFPPTFFDLASILRSYINDPEVTEKAKKMSLREELKYHLFYFKNNKTQTVFENYNLGETLAEYFCWLDADALVEIIDYKKLRALMPLVALRLNHKKMNGGYQAAIRQHFKSPKIANDTAPHKLSESFKVYIDTHGPEMSGGLVVSSYVPAIQVMMSFDHGCYTMETSKSNALIALFTDPNVMKRQKDNISAKYGPFELSVATSEEDKNKEGAVWIQDGGFRLDLSIEQFNEMRYFFINHVEKVTVKPILEFQKLYSGAK